MAMPASAKRRCRPWHRWLWFEQIDAAGALRSQPKTLPGEASGWRGHVGIDGPHSAANESLLVEEHVSLQKQLLGDPGSLLRVPYYEEIHNGWPLSDVHSEDSRRYPCQHP